jgi:hypothetical protein
MDPGTPPNSAAAASQIVERLLAANGFLVAAERGQLGRPAEWPAIPLSAQKELKSLPPGIEHRKLAPNPDLLNPGVLLGWLYVTLVWLREADRSHYQRVVKDGALAAEFQPVLQGAVLRWNVAARPHMPALVRHLRSAVSRGHVVVEQPVEGVPMFLFTSLSRGRIRAEFRLSGADLIRLTEALWRAHAARARGGSGEVST